RCSHWRRTNVPATRTSRNCAAGCARSSPPIWTAASCVPGGCWPNYPGAIAEPAWVESGQRLERVSCRDAGGGECPERVAELRPAFAHDPLEASGGILQENGAADPAGRLQTVQALSQRRCFEIGRWRQELDARKLGGKQRPQRSQRLRIAYRRDRDRVVEYRSIIRHRAA